MKLTIDTGTGVMYANNVRFCFAEAGNGRTSIPVGRYPVTTQFAHGMGTELTNAEGLGWIGHFPECAIRVGQVRGSSTLVQCAVTAERLVRMVERAEDSGTPVTLTVHQ